MNIDNTPQLSFEELTSLAKVLKDKIDLNKLHTYFMALSEINLSREKVFNKISEDLNSPAPPTLFIELQKSYPPAILAGLYQFVLDNNPDCSNKDKTRIVNFMLSGIVSCLLQETYEGWIGIRLSR